MYSTGELVDYDGKYLYYRVAAPPDYEVSKKGFNEAGIRFIDDRTITEKQRAMAYATMKDISIYTGFMPEQIKALMKYDFISRYGGDYFSLSDVDMTTANEFLNFIIEFCIENDIPTNDSLLERSPDISRYLYACLANKRCAVCGKASELHHTNHVGSGRNRKEILHLGMKAEPLCRIHHSECHTIGQQSFDDKYHIYGIKLDKYLCEILKLKGR